MVKTASPLHDAVDLRLGAAGQRYTQGRRRLIEVLEGAGRPMSMVDILEEMPGMPQSSAYRHLTVLASCGVVHRVAASDDFGFFELTDELSGVHHHHVLCGSCGTVVDVESVPKLERALAEAAELAAEDTGFEIDAHRIDLVGRCPDCQRSNRLSPRPSP